MAFIIEVIAPDGHIVATCGFHTNNVSIDIALVNTQHRYGGTFDYYVR